MASRVALVAGWVSQQLWPQALTAMSAQELPRPLLRQWRQRSHRPLFHQPALMEARQEVDHLALAVESPQSQPPV